MRRFRHEKAAYSVDGFMIIVCMSIYPHTHLIFKSQQCADDRSYAYMYQINLLWCVYDIFMQTYLHKQGLNMSTIIQELLFVYVYVHTIEYICLYIHIHKNRYIYIYIYMYIYIYICIYIYTPIPQIYKYVYACVCVCVCVYAFIHIYFGLARALSPF